VPNKSTVQLLVERFRETGSIGEKRRSGRPSVLSNDSLEDIRARLVQTPRKSLRKLSQQTGMTYGSVQRATMRLKLHPYRVQVCHEGKDIDKKKRMRYCRWFRQFVRNGVDILKNVFFSNEAWFHLCGLVNSQYSRFWSIENPHLFHEVSLHSQKIGCWFVISRNRIVGPIFFSETVTAEKYQDIIIQFISLLDEERFWRLQQDGAPSNTSNSTVEKLKQFFDDRIMNKNLWPPRSPDLTPQFTSFGVI
jgi:hypothetical protein